LRPADRYEVAGSRYRSDPAAASALTSTQGMMRIGVKLETIENQPNDASCQLLHNKARA
jgi:hypothetical protein